MENRKDNEKACCGGRWNGIRAGLLAGLLAHSFCIAFLIAMVIGSTFAVSVLTPFLLNPDFFYALICLSIAFATVAAVFYLDHQGCLSAAGIARKWRYLATLYASIICVNALFFFVIFPLAAGFGTVRATGFAPAYGTNALTLDVAIPCPGHAPLITGALKNISGVTAVSYQPPATFKIIYDSAQTSKNEILALEVFKHYSAEVVG